MVLFFAGGFVELRADGGVTRKQRLPLVQRLGAHLTHVIDAHQASGMTTLCLGELGRVTGASGRGTGGDDGIGRVRSAGAGNAGHSAQGAVEFGKEIVEHAGRS